MYSYRISPNTIPQPNPPIYYPDRTVDAWLSAGIPAWLDPFVSLRQSEYPTVRALAYGRLFAHFTPPNIGAGDAIAWSAALSEECARALSSPIDRAQIIAELELRLDLLGEDIPRMLRRWEGWEVAIPALVLGVLDVMDMATALAMCGDAGEDAALLAACAQELVDVLPVFDRMLPYCERGHVWMLASYMRGLIRLREHT